MNDETLIQRRARQRRETANARRSKARIEKAVREKVASSGVPILAIKLNTDLISEPCALCGKVFRPDGEIDLFLDGTEKLVCDTCGEKFAPLLVALQDLSLMQREELFAAIE